MNFSQAFNKVRHYLAANDWTDLTPPEREEMEKEGWLFTERLVDDPKAGQRPAGHNGWHHETLIAPGRGGYPLPTIFSNITSPRGLPITADEGALREFRDIRRRIADKVFKPF